MAQPSYRAIEGLPMNTKTYIIAPKYFHWVLRLMFRDSYIGWSRRATSFLRGPRCDVRNSDCDAICVPVLETQLPRSIDVSERIIAFFGELALLTCCP